MSDIKRSGNYGTDISWTLDKSGCLNITGTGVIGPLYHWSAPPFTSIKDKIRSVNINEGITGIGRRTFNFCKKLTSVHLPESMLLICEEAFSDCRHLTSINVPQNLLEVRTNAFIRTPCLPAVADSFNGKARTTILQNFTYHYARISDVFSAYLSESPELSLELLAALYILADYAIVLSGKDQRTCSGEL